MSELQTDQVKQLESLLESTKLKDNLVSRAGVLDRYSPFESELRDLLIACRESGNKLSRVNMRAKETFDPGDKFDPADADLVELNFFKFIKRIGAEITDLSQSAASRVGAMSFYTEAIIKALDGSVVGVDVDRYAAALIAMIQQELETSVFGFERVMANIYLNAKKEYRRLRRKFTGVSGITEKDDTEDDLFSQIFGQRRQVTGQEKPGPAMAIVEDNAFLTSFLLDISDIVPKTREVKVPVMRRGKTTGDVKSVRRLDESEVDECQELFMAASDPLWIIYSQEPSVFLERVMAILVGFHGAYIPVAQAIIALALKPGFAMVMGADNKRGILNVTPNTIKRQFLRINYTGIRPEPSDVEPKTRSEREFSEARTKLLLYILETLTNLSRMDRDAASTEEMARVCVVEAVKLKDQLEEISRTQRDRELGRNIRDDNEFYIAKTEYNMGSPGILNSERAPAPRIQYEDIVGESFVKARHHVEEVIKVASHPHIMRISAPRGDVKSNIALIGPYGCGKSELARAICADRRIIGFNVAVSDVLTAYMHESVKNVKRMFDCASDMRKASRYTKPVGIVIDEFDRFFNYGEGQHQAYDGPRMEGALQEMMDGVVGYEGVFLVTMTNAPKSIPEAILRRFKYVDVVGQLTGPERSMLFKKFVTRGLPISPSVTEDDWTRWADSMEHAPGDVIGKVADEIHFKFMNHFVTNNPARVEGIERMLARRLRDREINDKDRRLSKEALSKHRFIEAGEVQAALDEVLRQPQVKMQINKAKEVYRDAEQILAGLSKVGKRGLGFENDVTRRSELWGQ